MSYVKILITTPKGETTTAFDVEEFKQYIDNDTYNKFTSDKDFADNFNSHAPNNTNYRAEILEITDTKPFVYDATKDRLILAEYALNCYKDPENVLNNIADKLYQYKHLFSNRKLKLNNMDSIQHEKNVLNTFYKNLQKASLNYSERKSQELIDFIQEQANRQQRR